LNSAALFSFSDNLNHVDNKNSEEINYEKGSVHENLARNSFIKNNLRNIQKSSIISESTVKQDIDNLILEKDLASCHKRIHSDINFSNFSFNLKPM
jgi:hypothetical protein